MLRRIFNFIKKVFKKAVDVVVSTFKKAVKSAPAVAFMTVASIGFTAIIRPIVKMIRIPAFINSARIAPAIGFIIVISLVVFMHRADPQDQLSHNLYEGIPVFIMVNPGLAGVFKVQWIKGIFKVRKWSHIAMRVATKKESLSDVIGKELGKSFLNIGTSRVRRVVFRWNMMAQIDSDRTLPDDPIIKELETKNKRRIRRLRVVYHDASKAGKHLDVHVGRTSFVYRISGKPVESEIKYNSKGELTENAKKALMDHLRSEIASNARVAQNLDHSPEDAACSWRVGEAGLVGYGSGNTRQVVSEGDIEIGRRIYAPLIDPYHGLYIHQLYPGSDKKAPICIFGTIDAKDMDFEDRLSLRMTRNLEAFKGKIDPSTVSRKYDGASAYFVSDGKTLRMFSPRVSSVTGKRIEYTWKAPEIEQTAIPEKPVGIGEFLIWKRTLLGNILKEFGIRGPEGLAWNYLSSNQIGGILNENKIRPQDTMPEIRLYRVDSWTDGTHRRRSTNEMPFSENRLLQMAISRYNPQFVKVVDLCNVQHNENWEGLVGVSHGHSINKGMKLVFSGGSNDWRVIGNNLQLNERGNVEGAVRFKSLESGKEFNLGPGQMGDHAFNKELIGLGDRLVGSVAKVESKRGHEGRASQFKEWHLDKGISI